MPEKEMMEETDERQTRGSQKKKRCAVAPQ